MNYTREQIDAIKASPDRNALLVALAGAGKTTTVASQVAYLIKKRGFAPQNFVALSYSVHAADSLRDGITKMVETKIDGPVLGLAEMQIGTLHAWAAKILRDRVRRYSRYEIWEDAKRRLFAHSLFTQLGIGQIPRLRGDGSPTLTAETHDLGLFFEVIDRLRAECVPVDRRVGLALEAAHDAYVAALDAARAWDYPAIFAALHNALTSADDPDFLALQQWVTDTVRLVIVDEAQDLSTEMWNILDRLHTLGARLWVVADARQCIFTFRSADAGRIKRFAQEYDAVVYPLSTNFRTSDAGVAVANSFLSRYLL